MEQQPEIEVILAWTSDAGYISMAFGISLLLSMGVYIPFQRLNHFTNSESIRIVSGWTVMIWANALALPLLGTQFRDPESDPFFPRLQGFSATNNIRCGELDGPLLRCEMLAMWELLLFVVAVSWLQAAWPFFDMSRSTIMKREAEFLDRLKRLEEQEQEEMRASQCLHQDAAAHELEEGSTDVWICQQLCEKKQSDTSQGSVSCG